MKEKIHTIPVNDAFDARTECPVCSMYRDLERRAIEFVLGPSYMEDDIRTKTNELGFCGTHLTMLLKEKNRLGLAMILKTHLDAQLAASERYTKVRIKPRNPLKADQTEVARWAQVQSRTCYICAKIDNLFPQYVDTTVYLWQHEPEFREKYDKSKGFCGEHLALLIEAARKRLKGEELQTFYDLSMRLYRDGLQRVRDDLEWFAQKFDYRFRDEPWKESKDSIERAAVKTNSLLGE